MRAGKLKHLVQLQQPAVGKDAIGQPLTGFVTFDEAWADIRHQGGLESIKGAAETSIVKASIRFRYRTDLTSAMRIVHGTTAYEIRAVLPDEAGREYVDVVCEVVQ